MQACIYEEYGPAAVVRLGEVAAPVAKAKELVVRVHAASVTTADWRLRASEFSPVFWLPGRLWLGLLRPRNPILGMDFSGVVESVGEGVTRFRPGDRVFGATGASSRGAHAELLAVPESGAVVATPASLSDEEAAAIPFGANAALQFLRDFGAVKPGQRVLIVGASGGVGVWAVQLARHLGAKVTGVASTANLELVRSLGAHDVRDYGAGPFVRAGDDFELIFDTVGVTTFAGVKAALAPSGTYLPLNSGLREMVQALLTSKSRGKRVKYAVSGNTREDLEQVASLVESGVLRPVVDEVFPMERIVDAHRRVEGRHKRGSVIVRVAGARIREG